MKFPHEVCPKEYFHFSLFPMLLNLDHIPSDHPAVIDSEGNTITYGQIVRQAETFRKQYTERTLCFLLVENTAQCALTIMAALASERLVPLILNLHTEPTLLEHLNDTYQPVFVWKEKESFTPTSEDAGETLYPQLSHLLPTSGSTGSPKLIRHCYDNIEASALNISTFFQLTDQDRPLLVLPLYYTMGLSVLFSHLSVGATILLTGQSMTSARFWQFMKEEQATSFTGVPYSYHILNLMRFFRMDLPHLRLLTQGGGKMPTDLNRRFAEYCRDTGRRWIATYGQSECTARMAWLPPEWACDKVGSIGIAVPNGELSLIDTQGNTITHSHVQGEMCYRGRNVTLGYAHTRADLALGDERHGFIHTGDLAYRDDDGCYYIVGRLSRFLKLYGQRIGLDECEQIVQGIVGSECACVGTDQQLIVYITDATRSAEVSEALIAATRLPATSFQLRVIDRIPKNEAGKKLYQQLPQY